MLNKYFSGELPTYQYEERYDTRNIGGNDVTIHNYVFYKNGEIDTSLVENCKSIEEFEAFENKKNYIINQNDYIESYCLEDAINDMDNALDLLNKAINSPLNPKCNNENISKDQLIALINKMSDMCTKISENL